MDKIQMLKDIVDYEIEHFEFENYNENCFNSSRAYYKCLLSYQHLIQKLIDLDMEEK